MVKFNTRRITLCSGFTIVELIVVVAIIAILPVIVVSNFGRIKSQFALSRVVHKFSQDVRATQDLALSAVPYKDSFGVLQLVGGYGLYINLTTLGKTTYVVYADNNDGGLSNKKYDALDYPLATYNFAPDEPGIIIKEITGVTDDSASINFHPPNPTTTITELNAGEQQVNIVFALAYDPATTKTVSINASGLVYVQ